MVCVRWQNPVTFDVPLLPLYIARNPSNSASSRWLVDSDYLSLRQVSFITYERINFEIKN
jgi:hypothetical protein